MTETLIIDANELDNVIYQFRTKKDLIKPDEERIDMTFRKDDFVQLEGEPGETIYKMAVFHMIQNEATKEDQKALSIEHQILCDETAIVGVLKQTDKATGEIAMSRIEFKKVQLNDYSDNGPVMEAQFDVIPAPSRGSGRGGPIEDPEMWLRDAFEH